MQRKKIIDHYAKIALGLLILGGVAILFQSAIQYGVADFQTGSWDRVPGLVLYILVIFAVVVPLLWAIDKWFEGIISHMAGLKPPPND